MAFSCKIYLKNECDGCGLCEGPMHGFKPALRMPFDDDDYDPYYDPYGPDYEDER